MANFIYKLNEMPKVKTGDILYTMEAVKIIELPSWLERHDGMGEDFFYQNDVVQCTVSKLGIETFNFRIEINVDVDDDGTLHISAPEPILTAEIQHPDGNTLTSRFEYIYPEKYDMHNVHLCYFRTYAEAKRAAEEWNKSEMEFLAKFNEENGTSLSFEGGNNGKTDGNS